MVETRLGTSTNESQASSSHQPPQTISKEAFEKRRASLTCPYPQCGVKGKLTWRDGNKKAGPTLKCVKCTKSIPPEIISKFLIGYPQNQQDSAKPGPSIDTLMEENERLSEQIINIRKLHEDMVQRCPKLQEYCEKQEIIKDELESKLKQHSLAPLTPHADRLQITKEEWSSLMNKVDMLASMGQNKSSTIDQLEKRVTEMERRPAQPTSNNDKKLVEVIKRLDDVTARLDVIKVSNKDNYAGHEKSDAMQHTDGENKEHNTTDGINAETLASNQNQKRPEPTPTGQIEWTKINWSNISQLPPAVRERIVSGKTALQAEGFSGVSKPRVAALYVKGISRGPIGSLRRCLQKSLPKWGVLSLSFIGNAITEILCHQPLHDRIVSTLSLLGIRAIKGFNPCKPLSDNPDGTPERIFKVLCARRCKRLATESRSPACKEWYEGYVSHILSMDPSITSEEITSSSQSDKKTNSMLVRVLLTGKKSQDHRHRNSLVKARP